MIDKKSAKNSTSNVSTDRPIRGASFEKVPAGRGFLPWLSEMSRKRGFVTWLAAYVRRSLRQLANLAIKYGIPRAQNAYNFDWGADLDATVALIRDLTRFRKGNRKRPPKRKKRVSLLDQFGRTVHRAAKILAIDKIETLHEEIQRAPQARLRSIENWLGMLNRVRLPIERRLHRDLP